jgi:hypothetical protein
MSERAELVAQLVKRGPLSEEDLGRLSGFGWDSDEALVVLTRGDARAMLERHLQGELTGDDLSDWADQVEARDDIGFEAGHADALRELIFELANPPIRAEPTTDAARRWLTALG